MSEPEDFICDCGPGWCSHLQQNLLGHAFDIAKMDNNLGRRTRKIWLRKAKIQSTRPVEPIKPCNCGGFKL